jgi:hypothetical protein
VPYFGDSEKDLNRFIGSIFPNLNADITGKGYITPIMIWGPHIMIGWTN